MAKEAEEEKRAAEEEKRAAEKAALLAENWKAHLFDS